MRSNLINARREQGLTQLQLSMKIGTSVRNYQYLEAGTSNGSLKLWQKIGKELNKNIDYLLNNCTTVKII